jgi:hypothetical protein
MIHGLLFTVGCISFFGGLILFVFDFFKLWKKESGAWGVIAMIIGALLMGIFKFWR